MMKERMSTSVILLSTCMGLAAVFVVYLVFVAREFVKAGRSGLAMGIGVFPHVATRPAFWALAAIAFALVFYMIAQQ